MGGEFTERELLLLIHSAHGRAMSLLDMSCAMAQKGYRHFDGTEPIKKDIDDVHQLYEEYISLVEKLRVLRERVKGK